MHQQRSAEWRFQTQPSKYFLFSKTSSRRLQDFFSVTSLVFEDVLKTSWRHICKTSSKNVFKTSSQEIFKTFSRRLQDVFKTSSIRVCNTSSWRRLEDVLKTSWKTKKCYTEDAFKTSSRHLPYVFTKTNVCWEVSGFHSLLFRITQAAVGRYKHARFRKSQDANMT